MAVQTKGIVGRCSSTVDVCPYSDLTMHFLNSFEAELKFRQTPALCR